MWLKMIVSFAAVALLLPTLISSLDDGKNPKRETG
jgi:hypothetical protein